LKTTAAVSAPDSQTPDLPVTAFERRFGHPPGLAVLFFTQMWERFAYFGVRGLLKLYMVNYLFVTIRQAIQGGSYAETGDPGSVMGWRFVQGLLPAAEPEMLDRCIAGSMPRLLAGNASTHLAPLAADAARSVAEQTCAVQPQASMVYGLFTGLIMLTPLFGGVIADRLVGQRRAVIGGIALLMIGCFALAFDGAFFLSLALLMLGSASFRPNLTVQVADLYRPGDPRRDGGFTLFYMGINLGAILSNLVCGTVAAVYGWHQGFASAGVAMGLGLIVYLVGQKHLPPDARSRGLPSSGGAAPAPAPGKGWAIAGIFVALCVLGVVFGTLMEQHGSAMQMFTEEQAAALGLSGSRVPMLWLLSVGPLAILVSAPLLDLFWRRQAKKGKEPGSVAKMAIGCFLLGGSFLLMIAVAGPTGTGQEGFFWPSLCIFLVALGELYFVPITLSLLTRIAPLRWASTMLGLFMLSSLFGNVLSGVFLSAFASSHSSNQGYFLTLAGLAAGAGGLLLACKKPLQRAFGSGV
jgi:POT family proton-dependent oligopeptide transporter